MQSAAPVELQEVGKENDSNVQSQTEVEQKKTRRRNTTASRKSTTKAAPAQESEKRERRNTVKEMIKRGIKPEVGIKPIVRITKVEDVENEVYCNFELIVQFNDEDLIDSSAKNAKDYEKLFDPPDWRPAFTLMGASDENPTREDYYVQRETGNVIQHLKYLVSFHQPLELERFPFDRQLITIVFNADNVRMKEWDPNMLGRATPAYYRLQSGVSTALSTWTLDSCSTSIKRGWRASIQIRLERRASYYFWNIVFVLFLLVLCSFCTVAVAPEDVADRQGISVTFVLTGVSYKYVVSELLPRISYLTWLDEYVILSFLLLILAVIENTVVAYLAEFGSSDIAVEVDQYYNAIMAGLWLLLHLVMIVAWKRQWFMYTWEKTIEEDDNHVQKVKNEFMQ